VYVNVLLGAVQCLDCLGELEDLLLDVDGQLVCMPQDVVGSVDPWAGFHDCSVGPAVVLEDVFEGGPQVLDDLRGFTADVVAFGLLLYCVELTVPLNGQLITPASGFPQGGRLSVTLG